jgi:BT1 family
LLWVHDAASNFLICAACALAWTFALLLQLDVAARLCPPRYAGTVFALLMGVSNGADLLSGYLGGSLHDRLAAARGGSVAYAVLVAIGAGATLLAWLLVPSVAKEQAIPR